MKNRFVFVFSMAAILCGCSGSRTLLEREEARRAKIEMNTIQDMVRTKQIMPVAFEFDSDILTEDSYPVLDKIAAILINNRSLKLVVEGHCDDVGSDEYNDDLSYRRAEAVKRYLTTHGVYPDYVKAYGFGKRRRITDDTSERGRAINRRVDFILTSRTWESVY